MENLKNELKNYVFKELKKKLYNYEDTSSYSCDLNYMLFEGENADGTYTYSTKDALDWIKEYWDDIGEVVEELKFQFGGMDYIPNVFERPEAFMVVIIIELAGYMLSQCPFINDNWNEEITLTKENIEKIINELEENNNTEDVYE